MTLSNHVKASLDIGFAAAFHTGIDAVLGDGACLVLQIRPEGGIELQPA